MSEPTFALIQEAVGVLRGVTDRTPVLTSQVLDGISGANVYLKCENFQRSGAFKFRGAYHAVSRLIKGDSIHTFATVSSGNHGQGLALACRILGANAHVIMPRPFIDRKQRAVLDYGATLHVIERRSEAERKLCEITERYGATIVHPFNDPLVIAGQGTIMVELLEQAGDFDVLLAPVGGGGLLSGLCLVAEACRPKIQIFACEPAGALDAMESVRQNRVLPMANPDTIADGLRTSLGDRTLAILRRCLAGFFVVQEEEIIRSMRFAYDHLRLVIEPSSAVAIAPLLRKEIQLAGRRVAVVLTGGNVDSRHFDKG